jgi:hypothetical protein
MAKYMYIVNTKYASIDYAKWDWEPIIQQWRDLMKEYNIKLIGRGSPMGSYDDWIAVYLTDIDPIEFAEFLTKSSTYDGKRIGQTSTTVVLSQD